MASVIEGAEYQHPAYTTKGDLASQAKDELKKVSGLTRTRLLDEADQRKTQAAQQLRQWCEALDRSGDAGELQPVLQKLSSTIRQASDALEHRSTEELIGQAQDQFRARPGLILAGLFAIGFAAGRLLRE